ncbi:hypothetical protein LTWDN19_15480 [Latilactobacillus curvatus]|uniref:Uncharacterized protein n=1 Tax=Latilactobacillus curvatus TaxID=28038 RepID=A0ABN6GJH8_LATCU|nr:hypothetical protein LTWDN19_15480 [Latilactobacillus curvatus]
MTNLLAVWQTQLDKKSCRKEHVSSRHYNKKVKELLHGFNDNAGADQTGAIRFKESTTRD